jgi:hypothetical protein
MADGADVTAHQTVAAVVGGGAGIGELHEMFRRQQKVRTDE